MVQLIRYMATPAAACLSPSPPLEPSPAPRRLNWSCPIDYCSLACSGVAEDGSGLAHCPHHGERAALLQLDTTSGLQLTQELVPSPPPPHVPPWHPPWPPPLLPPSACYNPPVMSSIRPSKKAGLAPGQVVGRSPASLLTMSPQRKIGSMLLYVIRVSEP